MKHMASGKIAFIAVLALAGCYSYASEAINNGNYTTVQATPNFVVVRSGDSTQVIARLVNANNNGAITSYTTAGVPAGIAVHVNPLYRPVFNSALDTLQPTGDKTAQQYFVVGVTPGKYSFTLTPTSVNTGVSGTINVIVTPRDLGLALSKTTGNAGDTVVITAPAGAVFSQTSAISFTTGGADTVVARSADSTTITFVTNGGHAGPVSVTKVGVIASPATQTATVASTNTLTTPAVSAGITSETTATAGDIVTITAPASVYFSPTSAITFAKGATPLIISRAADSSAITFQIGPDSGAAVVSNVGIRNAKGILALQSASSSTTISTPLVTLAVIAVNGVTTTLVPFKPNIGVPVTIQLPSNLRAMALTRVLIGGGTGRPAGIVSVSADSQTIVIMPMMGSFGVVQLDSVVVSTAPGSPFSVPTDKSINVTSTYGGSTDPNATAVATATTYVLAPGREIIVTDQGVYTAGGSCALSTVGGSGCRYYKFVVTATKLHDGELRWDATTNADMGLYILNAAGTSRTSAFADANGDQLGGPEVSATAGVSLAANTYVMAVVTYDATPQYMQFRLRERP